MKEKKSAEVLGMKSERCRVRGQRRGEMPSSLSALRAACLALLHSKLSRLSPEKRRRKFTAAVRGEAARTGKVELVC